MFVRAEAGRDAAVLHHQHPVGKVGEFERRALSELKTRDPGVLESIRTDREIKPATEKSLVGFLDGRPIGPSRVLVRSLVFWALFITGIGLLIMLIMMLRHPRKQGWH